MANSTTNLDLIAAAQSNKEVTANSLFDAASPAMLYGRRAVTSVGLTWGYFGGTLLSSGSLVAIANGTLTLAGSTTNYVEADGITGAVSVNSVSFTAGKIPLYEIATGSAGVASYIDRRAVALAGASAAVTSVNGQTDDVVLDAGDVGADPAGTASSAITGHVGESDPHTQYQKESEKGAANGYASLDGGGKLPTSQLPNLAIIDFLGTVANQTAMLALSGQKGDWCARSDTSTVWVITGADPTLIGSWTALSYPTGTGGTVTSVGLTTPGVLFDVSGSPVTGAGTLAFTLKTQVKNTFLAGPATGADAAPTMRTLTQADLPAQPFDITAFYPGVPSASVTITRVPVARAVAFPSGLSGSVGKASVAATSQTDFDVQKNGSSVGTVRFSAASTSATFIAVSAFTLAAGDILSIIAPSSADATLADVGIVLAGTR